MNAVAFSIFFIKFTFFNFNALISILLFFKSFSFSFALFPFSTTSSNVYCVFKSSSISSILVFSSLLSFALGNFSSVFLDFFPLYLKKYFTFPKNVFLHSKNVEICFSLLKYSTSKFSVCSFNFFNLACKLLFSFTQSISIFNNLLYSSLIQSARSSYSRTSSS